jgi:threonine/homoserine/homoserine lactone efflux protein
MPSPATVLTFLATSAILVAVPGPNLLYILTRGAHGGRRAGLLSAAGVETATLVHVFAATLGLSAIVAASRPAYAAVTLAGAAYLLWLGYRTWRTAPTTQVATSTATDAFQVYRDGVLVNLLNPKVGLFFVAFLPQFVSPGVPMLVLGGMFFFLALTLDIAYAVVGAAVGRRLAGWRPIRYLTIGVYLMLASYAAVAAVST